MELIFFSKIIAGEKSHCIKRDTMAFLFILEYKVQQMIWNNLLAVLVLYPNRNKIGNPSVEKTLAYPNK